MDDEKPSCFVIMPITLPEHLAEKYGDDPDHFDDVYEHLFKPAILDAGFTPHKPVARGSVEIKAGIIKQLVEADLVLCDMSTLNANVFFELGVRTALNRPTAMVRDVHLTKVPFDVSGINYHPYDPNLHAKRVKAEVPKLTAHLKETWQADRTANALWRIYGLQVQGSGPPSGGAAEQERYLGELIRKVERLVSTGGSDAVRPQVVTDREFATVWRFTPMLSMSFGAVQQRVRRVLKEFLPGHMWRLSSLGPDEAVVAIFGDLPPATYNEAKLMAVRLDLALEIAD